MSMSNVQIAVLPTGPGSAPRRVFQKTDGRPTVRVLAFAALALYGALRWGSLVSTGSSARLLGLVVLATLVAAGGPVLAFRSRLLAGLGVLIAAAVALAIAGIPASWIVNLRVAVTARAIGDGLSTLPNVNVPYDGVDQWVQLTITLGAAVLLLTAAVVLTFVPLERGLMRLAGAVLPLLTLAVIPTTILRPAVPSVEGVLLFGLLIAFVWGDRIGRTRMAGVVWPCAFAVLAALILAPAFDSSKPWINYRSIASALAPTNAETFNWAQSYGPLHWPRTHRTVLEIQASRPEYWKAQNLDVFNGSGWTAAEAPTTNPWQDGVSRSALKRWTQTLQVTVRSMATDEVIAAGSARQPQDVPGGTASDLSSGTWLAGKRLEPGASYKVTVYSPHPAPAQLASAGTSYPQALRLGYLSLAVPGVRRLGSGSAQPEVHGQPGIVSLAYTPNRGYLVKMVFPPFRSHIVDAGPVAAAMRASPYAGAFDLAQRLAKGAATPYAYVERVQAFLGHGFTYDEHPPTSSYPLESFLVSTRRGYCQHFAGAMALLLRMGGVPARVAVGFTTGSYDSSLHTYTVPDSDAHAWVEAWFPHYGWVKFDPTPRADPALGGNGAQPTAQIGLHAPLLHPGHASARKSHASSRAAGAAQGPARGGASFPVAGVVAPIAAFALLIVLMMLSAARGGGDPVDELARAFARTGRPLNREVTLVALERRLAGAPEAAAYVHGLRLARFTSRPEPVSLRRRRALRRALASDLGVAGRLRALWALPPRWQPPWRGRPEA